MPGRQIKPPGALISPHPVKKKGTFIQAHTVSLLIIAFCIVMSAYFSATETAFSSLNRIKMKNMAEKGNRRAVLVLQLSESYDTLLSTILIGNNIVNIASASLATVLFVRLLGEESGPSISTLVTTVVVLIFGEISPKSIAKESPERFAMFSGAAAAGVYRLPYAAEFSVPPVEEAFIGSVQNERGHFYHRGGSCSPLWMKPGRAAALGNRRAR